MLHSKQYLTGLRNSVDLVLLINKTCPLSPDTYFHSDIYQGSCPFCKNNTLQANKKVFRCNSCRIAGDCFQWVSLRDSVDIIGAVDALVAMLTTSPKQPSKFRWLLGGKDTTYTDSKTDK